MSGIIIGGREFSGSVDYQANTETVYSEYESADPSWRFTDRNHHQHYYDKGGYPTLDYIVDEQHWCEGNEGIAPHDPHWAVDKDHFECRECRVVVEPGTLPPGYPQTFVSSKEFEVTVVGDLPFREVDGLLGERPGRFYPLQQSCEAGLSPVTVFAFVPS